MRILVTGAAGQLARAVLPRLCHDRAIDRIVALDRRPIDFSHQKIAPLSADLRTTQLAPLLRNCDALVHLAWTVLRGRTSARAMRANNIDASQKLFLTAQAAGVKRLIHVSSAAVYGSGSLLTEHSALQPLDQFLYAQHKAEFEAWLATEIPTALVLRPHIILGPNALPLLRAVLALPLYVRLPDPQPLLQCVHEQDVADAIARSLHSAQAGPFNLAAADVFNHREVIRARHRRALAVPYPLARLALHAAWRLTGFGAEPGWLEGIRADLTLDCGQARQLLGWQPRWSSREALQQTATRASFRFGKHI